MSEEKYGERIAIVEQKVVNHENRLEKLESSNETLIKLATLVEMQTEMNKDQNATLEKINDNLSHLNNTSEQLRSSVGDLGSRISSIEATQESHKIDVPKLLVKIAIGVAMISVGLLSAWLLKATGLK